MRSACAVLATLACGIAGVALLGDSATLNAEGAGRPENTTRTYTLYTRPFLVGPYGTRLDGGQTRSPGVDGFITHMDARIVDARTGRVVPQYTVMLHHLVFMDSGTRHKHRPDAACPADPHQRFFGTSEELRALDLPSGFGYPIAARERWSLGVMLMNHTYTTRNVRIRYRMRVLQGRKLAPVTPYWLSVQACGGDPQYTIAGGGRPGSTSPRSAEFTLPKGGRIVAVGGRLHGGARSLTLDQPRCGARLATAQPTYAPGSDPLYHIYPRLHEPDPKTISWWQSSTGVPIVGGEKVVVTANYANDNPYMRVMGIMHVYVAEGDRISATCDPHPAARVDGPGVAGGRLDPPHSLIALAALARNGHAHLIGAPVGAVQAFTGNTEIAVHDFAFRPPNISVPLGANVTWKFPDHALHDATVASGPRGFAASYSRSSQTFRQSFDVPGTYRLFCSLHPTAMSETVIVRPGAASSVRAVKRVSPASAGHAAWPFRP